MRRPEPPVRERGAAGSIHEISFLLGDLTNAVQALRMDAEQDRSVAAQDRAADRLDRAHLRDRLTSVGDSLGQRLGNVERSNADVVEKAEQVSNRLGDLETACNERLDVLDRDVDEMKPTVQQMKKLLPKLAGVAIVSGAIFAGVGYLLVVGIGWLFNNFGTVIDVALRLLKVKTG
jgi:chromosome segregation ATPase